MINFNAIEMGQRIKTLRKSKSLSQKELAHKIIVSQKTISRYENGLVHHGIDILVQLAIALDTSTDYLLGLADFE